MGFPDKHYGRCILRDGGFGRRILYVPDDLVRGLRRHYQIQLRTETIGNHPITILHAEVFNRAFPYWASQYKGWYAVEMSASATEEKIQEFADKIATYQPPPEQPKPQVAKQVGPQPSRPQRRVWPWLLAVAILYLIFAALGKVPLPW
jgi:hypothetical protein